MSETDSEPLRLGMVGAGVMAKWSILASLHLAPVRFPAICDLDEDRARSVTEKFAAGRSVMVNFQRRFIFGVR